MLEVPLLCKSLSNVFFMKEVDHLGIETCKLVKHVSEMLLCCMIVHVMSWG